MNETWDFSQERQFIENLLCTRFNFFLVFYSLVVIGFVTTAECIYKPIILILGSAISILLALVIYRSHLKLGLILKNHLDIGSNKPTHPAGIIDQECNQSDGWVHKLFSVRWIIGWLIPLLCCLSLLVGAILSCFNII